MTALGWARSAVRKVAGRFSASHARDATEPRALARREPEVEVQGIGDCSRLMRAAASRFRLSPSWAISR